jgi:hypothetical protein
MPRTPDSTPGGTVVDFERRFERRKRDGVDKPRKETDLSFAAHLVEVSRRNPPPRFNHFKVKP